MKDYPYVPGWRLNKENNKPAIKHSVLMLTRHGIAEGEWDGSEWIQYRWSGKFKDSDVFYWIHLEDLQQLEKEGENIQQEQPDFPTTDEQMKEFLATHPKVEVPEKYKTPDFVFEREQPRVNLEKEIEIFTTRLYHETFGNGQGTLDEFDWEDIATVIEETARHFYELGLNTKK